MGKEPDDYLFTRVQIRKGPIHEYTERRVVDFRSAWGRATKAAGKPDLHFHDLCRFASRRRDRAGVGRKTAMAVMGRKTDSIYRRYNVVDHRDRDLAVDRLDYPITPSMFSVSWLGFGPLANGPEEGNYEESTTCGFLGSSRHGHYVWTVEPKPRSEPQPPSYSHDEKPEPKPQFAYLRTFHGS